jgi:hypothetical protein
MAAARRHPSRTDRSHFPASRLIDIEMTLPNPFAEIGEQGQPRKRKASGTKKPARREL